MAPDTLTPERLDEIRQSATLSGFSCAPPTLAELDRHDLLAHIDTLTAAVEALEPRLGGAGQGQSPGPSNWYFDGFDEAKDAVLAILRGEYGYRFSVPPTGRDALPDSREEPHDA